MFLARGMDRFKFMLLGAIPVALVRGGDVYSYFGEADTVHFVVRGGAIIKVKWELYFD